MEAAAQRALWCLIGLKVAKPLNKSGQRVPAASCALNVCSAVFRRSQMPPPRFFCPPVDRWGVRLGVFYGRIETVKKSKNKKTDSSFLVKLSHPGMGIICSLIFPPRSPPAPTHQGFIPFILVSGHQLDLALTFTIVTQTQMRRNGGTEIERVMAGTDSPLGVQLS